MPPFWVGQVRPIARVLPRQVERQRLFERIAEYLERGGLHNPECMDHAKVRDLIIALRDHLQCEPAGDAIGAAILAKTFLSGIHEYATEEAERFDKKTITRALLERIAGRLSSAYSTVEKTLNGSPQA